MIIVKLRDFNSKPLKSLRGLFIEEYPKFSVPHVSLHFSKFPVSDALNYGKTQ